MDIANVLSNTARQDNDGISGLVSTRCTCRGLMARSTRSFLRLAILLPSGSISCGAICGFGLGGRGCGGCDGGLLSSRSSRWRLRHWRGVGLSNGRSWSMGNGNLGGCAVAWVCVCVCIRVYYLVSMRGCVSRCVCRRVVSSVRVCSRLGSLRSGLRWLHRSMLCLLLKVSSRNNLRRSQTRVALRRRDGCTGNLRSRMSRSCLRRCRLLGRLSSGCCASGCRPLCSATALTASTASTSSTAGTLRV